MFVCSVLVVDIALGYVCVCAMFLVLRLRCSLRVCVCVCSSVGLLMLGCDMMCA